MKTNIKTGVITGIGHLTTALYFAAVIGLGVGATKAIYAGVERSRLEEQVQLEQEASHKLLKSVNPGDTLLYDRTGYNLLTDLDGDGSPDVLRVEHFFSPSYGSKPETKYYIKKGAKIPQWPGEDAVVVESEFFEKYSHLIR